MDKIYEHINNKIISIDNPIINNIQNKINKYLILLFILYLFIILLLFIIISILINKKNIII